MPTTDAAQLAVRGRYAPSPTGLLHLGNARTALVAWLSARSQGGTFVWRLEDLDTPRVVPGMAEAALRDLQWLGLDWDESPDQGGPFPPYAQSGCTELYTAALQQLGVAGRLFPCRRSRKDLHAIASAPHGAASLPPYPASLRPKHLSPGWLDRLLHAKHPEAAIRFQVHDQPVTFTDSVQGRITEFVSHTVGDYVLRRRDGLFAYQLAVVVDDLRMGITEVVRGADLLASTARQIQLIEALGGKPPTYAHVPLVLNAKGEKLSKRDDGLTLEALRLAGIQPAQLIGYFAYSLGLRDQAMPCLPHDLLPDFSWGKLHRNDWVLPGDFIDQLKHG